MEAVRKSEILDYSTVMFLESVLLDRRQYFAFGPTNACPITLGRETTSQEDDTKSESSSMICAYLHTRLNFNLLTQLSVMTTSYY